MMILLLSSFQDVDKYPIPTALSSPAAVSNIGVSSEFKNLYVSGTNDFLSFHMMQFAELSKINTSESESKIGNFCFEIHSVDVHNTILCNFLFLVAQKILLYP